MYRLFNIQLTGKRPVMCHTITLTVGYNRCKYTNADAPQMLMGLLSETLLVNLNMSACEGWRGVSHLGVSHFSGLRIPESVGSRSP